MGQKVSYYLGKVDIGPPTLAHQQEDNPSENLDQQKKKKVVKKMYLSH